MTISTSLTEAPSVPKRVGVLGGGRMGAGIAHAFLVSGAEVTVVERDAAAAAAAPTASPGRWPRPLRELQ